MCTVCQPWVLHNMLTTSRSFNPVLICSFYVSDVHVNVAAIKVIEATGPASDVWSSWEDICTSVFYCDHALLHVQPALQYTISQHRFHV